jgi:hypothetical protein
MIIEDSLSAPEIAISSEQQAPHSVIEMSRVCLAQASAVFTAPHHRNSRAHGSGGNVAQLLCVGPTFTTAPRGWGSGTPVNQAYTYLLYSVY